MEYTLTGWRNASNTGDRSCKCGSWKNHWINYSNKEWPKTCSIRGCSNTAELGAHISNPDVQGEQIVPACASCNNSDKGFNLKAGTVFVSANRSKTCE